MAAKTQLAGGIPDWLYPEADEVEDDEDNVELDDKGPLLHWVVVLRYSAFAKIANTKIKTKSSFFICRHSLFCMKDVKKKTILSTEIL